LEMSWYIDLHSLQGLSIDIGHHRLKDAHRFID
jgi:hypothetical protein